MRGVGNPKRTDEKDRELTGNHEEVYRLLNKI
jgi:hypothetical protein